MNIRQQKYKQNRLAGLNQYNAAIVAGYSESFARTRSKWIEEKVKIADVLERQGLTDNVLVTKHKELLNATKVIGYLNNRVNGTQKISDEFVETPDWRTRLGALRLVYELKGHLRQELNTLVNSSIKVINLTYGHREKFIDSSLRIEERNCQPT